MTVRKVGRKSRVARIARGMLLCAWVAAVPIASASALDWTTDPAVGPNEVAFTLDVTCPGISFACTLINGYSDTQVSTLTGAGTYLSAPGSETVRFETDSTQDVGSGPQAAYLTMIGTNLTFANLPFAGVPEVVNLLIFALTDPEIPVPGLDLMTPGDYPFSETISYSSLGEVVGDLEFILPDLVAPPGDVVVSGTIRVLGDIDLDGMIELELRDVTGTLGVSGPGNIAGEPVTVDITASLTANLSSEILGTGVAIVPSLGPAATIGLAALLTLAGSQALRRRQERAAR